MILSIIRWFSGYVFFQANGNYLEYFLDMATKKGINLWNITKNGTIMSGCALKNSVDFLLKIAKKTKTETKIESENGFPYLVLRYKKRLGIPVGIALYFGTLATLSMYVWSVRIHGAETIDKSEIFPILSELGLESGSLKKNIDIPIVKQLALARIPNAAWIAINFNGSIADVHIKEKSKTPDIVDNTEACNVIASRSGQIRTTETFAGTLAAQPGDAVAEGQILISGNVEDAFGSINLVHAGGKIFADTKRVFSEKIELSHLTKVETGKILKKRRFKLLNFEIPLILFANPSENCRVETNKFRPKIGNFTIPLTFFEEIFYEQKDEKIQFSQEEAEKFAFDENQKKFDDELATEISQGLEVKLLHKQEKIIRASDGDYAETTFFCNENIAKISKIE